MRHDVHVVEGRECCLFTETEYRRCICRGKVVGSTSHVPIEVSVEVSRKELLYVSGTQKTGLGWRRGMELATEATGVVEIGQGKRASGLPGTGMTHLPTLYFP